LPVQTGLRLSTAQPGLQLQAAMPINGERIIK